MARHSEDTRRHTALAGSSAIAQFIGRNQHRPIVAALSTRLSNRQDRLRRSDVVPGPEVWWDDELVKLERSPQCESTAHHICSPMNTGI
jgi:hypothetical protein